MGTRINMPIEGRFYTDLEKIKKHHGISNNTDIIRFLIRKEARDIDGRLLPLEKRDSITAEV